jgi:small-conductance mechanosensitive channel/nucleotide-binding universal stress UspA family protein
MGVGIPDATGPERDLSGVLDSTGFGLDQEVLGGFSLWEFSILATLVVLGILLAWLLPVALTNWFTRSHIRMIRTTFIKRAKKKKRPVEEAKADLRRVVEMETANVKKRLGTLTWVIRASVLLLMGYFIIWVTDRFLGNALLGGGDASFFLFFLVEVITILLLLQFGVRTIAEIVVYLALGSDIRTKERERINRGFQSTLNWFLGLLLVLLMLVFINQMVGDMHMTDLSPGGFIDEGVTPGQYLRPLIIFVFIISLTIIIAGIVLVFLKASVLHPRRVDPHLSKPMERILRYGFIIFGFIMAVSLVGFDMPEWGLVLLITVVGFVLGFGLQYQIANIIAGLSIAIDRPYVIGDRIRVGREAMGMETWGDVDDISLQTTRIVTTENELVTIPNYLMATNPVWNFTRGDRKQALNVKVGVSYGSDWRLAEKIILEKLHEHPRILKEPKPFVRIEEFGESSINFMIWGWVADGRDLIQVRSDILGAVKDGFDKGGVEIPFPYRTVVFKKDIPPEVRLTPEEKRAYKQVRRYTGADYEVHTMEGPVEEDEAFTPATRLPREIKHILVPTSGTSTAGMLAEYSMNLARKINANIIALYVQDTRSRDREEDGKKALEIFNRVGRAHHVSTSVRLRKGTVVDTILEVIAESDVDLVVMGSGEKGFLSGWGKEDMASEVLRRSNVPVVIMPFRPELMDLKGKKR